MPPDRLQYTGLKREFKKKRKKKPQQQQQKKQQKSLLVLIHLTPFAWRSGQTSSMLGGAQFKATLLTIKHLPAIYNAE